MNQEPNRLWKRVIGNILKHQKCELYIANGVALAKASVGYIERLPVYKVNAEKEKLHLHKAQKA